jgi:hypothetical protein
MCFSFSFHWSPNNGTLQGPPNNGTLQGPPSNGTVHWAPRNGTFLHIFPFPSLEDSEFGSFGAFFLGDNFRFEA